MLNSTTERGIIMGESPYAILSTNDSRDDSGIEVLQGQIENFILDERSHGGTLFLAPTDQYAPKVSRKIKK
jgi:hypothetical protein